MTGPWLAGREAGMQQANRQIALMDVLDRVLDKGIVIDAGVRVSVIGIEVVAVDVQIMVASIETYLQLVDDPRVHALGLVPPAPRHATEEALDRLTEPRRGPAPSRAPGRRAVAPEVGRE